MEDHRHHTLDGFVAPAGGSRPTVVICPMSDCPVYLRWLCPFRFLKVANNAHNPPYFPTAS
jgi:hypothetical protein